MAAENSAPLSLTKVPVQTLERLLASSGAQYFDRTTLECDRAAGAPIAEDGTVDLLAYAAWLVKELAHGT